MYLPDVDKSVVASDVRSKFDVSSAAGERIERLLARIVVIEFLAIAATCFITSNLYFYAVLTVAPSNFEYVSAALFIALLIVLLSLGLKQYVAIQAQPRDRFMLGGLGAVALGFSFFLSCLFLFKIGDWYSRATFFSQFFGVGAAVLLMRGLTHSYVRRAIQSGSIEARKAVLVGDIKSNAHIVKRLQRQGVHSGFLSFPRVHGYPVSGDEVFSPGVRNFVERCRAFKPDDIIFLAETEDLPRVAALVEPLLELQANVHVIPTALTEFWASAKVASLGETATIQVLRPPLSAFDLAIKRAFDICVSATGLIALSPLLLVVALAIKAHDGGSVLFGHPRIGFGGKPFRCWKFRTMVPSADEALANHLATDEEAAREWAQSFKLKRDPRITYFGRVLRETSIDELPQLLNVIKGEMSLVGPRPIVAAEVKKYGRRFAKYIAVRPGLTGLWQVSGRTQLSYRRRVAIDTNYVQCYSFGRDLAILLRTVPAVILRHGSC